MKLAALALLCPLLMCAQDKPPSPVAEGKALFRSNCAFCHGATGEGGRGPNLRGNLTHGNSIAVIKSVIRNGIPGTQMPAYKGMEADELDILARYVHDFSSAGGASQPVTGDATKGREIYSQTGCPSCHQIGEEGSVYGPDLTRVGAARSVDYLRESIIHPSADVPQEYEGVTVTTKAGQKLTGIRINEDTFTIQLRTMDQHYKLYAKDELQTVARETKSLMPAYSKLSPEQLNDLVAYLHSLRSAVGPNAIVEKAKGIQ